MTALEIRPLELDEPGPLHHPAVMRIVAKTKTDGVINVAGVEIDGQGLLLAIDGAQGNLAAWLITGGNQIERQRYLAAAVSVLRKAGESLVSDTPDADTVQPHETFLIARASGMAAFTDCRWRRNRHVPQGLDMECGPSGLIAVVSDGEKTVWISNMATAPEQRRLGHGDALLRWLLHAADVAGYACGLVIAPFDAVADHAAGPAAHELAAWYERHGFDPHHGSFFPSIRIRLPGAEF